MAVGAELSQPEGWLLLLPCTVHGAVLCWSQGWVTFIPSCAWRMTLHPPGSFSEWQLREMQAKGTTKYLGFSHVVEHSLPLQQEH